MLRLFQEKLTQLRLGHVRRSKLKQEIRWGNESRTEPGDGLAPLARVPHHDVTAELVVLGDTHGHDVGGALDVVGLVDLVLDREAVRVPAELALDVVPRLVGVPVI